MLDPNKIGKFGEKIVFELLPNSHWLNEKKESGVNFDIKWIGLKIDVKTTTGLIPSSKNLVQFTQNNFSDIHIVLVFVALIDEKKYFWIDFSENVGRIILKKLTDSFPQEELKVRLFCLLTTPNSSSNIRL